MVTVQFVDGTDSGQALQGVREQVAGIRNQLPDTIEEPVYQRVDLSLEPTLTLCVTGAAGQSGRDVYALLDQAIVPQIEQAEGVGSVTLIGGQERQINVNLNVVTVLGLRMIIIGTFAAMWLLGLTVNVISLLALSVAVGLVIDDAIVVRENIFRHIERGETRHHKPPPRIPGQEHLPDEAVEELGPMERFYERLVRWSLAHRGAMLGIAGVVVVLSMLSATGLKFAFLPSNEPHRFAVSIALPPGTPLSETDRVARAPPARFAEDEAVETVLKTVGGVGQTGTGGEQATFLVNLHEDASTPATQIRLRPLAAEFPGLIFGIPSVIKA